MSYSSLFGQNRMRLLRKFIGVMLVISVLGISPGIDELFNTYSSPAMASEEAKASSVPFSGDPFDIKVQGDDDAAAVKEAVANVDDEAEVDEADAVEKEMSAFEDIGWLVAKSLLPTIAVMAFSAAVAAPLALVIAGAIVVGAATAGLVTLGSELRKNSFRADDEKEGMDSILRTVSISAAINGAMAPFQLATAGLVSVVGPATLKSVAIAGAKTFGVQAASKAVMYGAKGAVMNAWYDHYYDYDDREKYLKYRIDSLQTIENITDEQSQELANAIEELDLISKEKYTFQNFKTDMKKGLVWAGVSGVLGGATARVAGDTKWAKVASSKIFGTPDKAGMVANAVTSNPFAFATGAGVDLVEKKAILKEIELTKELQSEYQPNTPVWEYYETKISGLQEQHDSINLVNSGTRMAISNAAIQTAMVGTNAITTRWGAYTAQKKKIQSEYEQDSAKWAEANETRIKLEQLKNSPPLRSNYKSYSEYKTALKSHEAQVQVVSRQYQASKVEAAAEQKLPLNRAKYNEIADRVKSEDALASRQALAKSIGKEEYIEFKVNELKNKPENQGLSDAELKSMASDEIVAEYKASAKSAADTLTEMTNRLRGKDKNAAEGEIEISADGKKYIVVKDQNGNEILRKSFSGTAETWWQKIFQKDQTKLEGMAIKKAVETAYTKGSAVKPSGFRDTYLEMRINQLKSMGYDNSQIDNVMPSLTEEATSEMLNAFGGSWESVVKSEFIAQGLAKAKYDDGEAPKIKDIGNFVGSNIETTVMGSLGRTIRGQLSEASFIGNTEQAADDYNTQSDNSFDGFSNNDRSSGWLNGVNGHLTTDIDHR